MQRAEVAVVTALATTGVACAVALVVWWHRRQRESEAPDAGLNTRAPVATAPARSLMFNSGAAASAPMGRANMYLATAHGFRVTSVGRELPLYDRLGLHRTAGASRVFFAHPNNLEATIRAAAPTGRHVVVTWASGFKGVPPRLLALLPPGHVHAVAPSEAARQTITGTIDTFVLHPPVFVDDYGGIVVPARLRPAVAVTRLQRVGWSGPVVQVSAAEASRDALARARLLVFLEPGPEWPTAAVQAMAAGTPVVAVNTPAVREAAGPAGAMLVVPDDDVQAAVGRVLGDPGVYEDLVSRGLSRAKELDAHSQLDDYAHWLSNFSDDGTKP